MPGMPGMNDKLVSGKPIALVLGVLLIGAGLFKWWPSDERAIRRQLDAVADTLTVPSTDTALSKITRLGELKNYLTPDARIDLGSFVAASRDAVMAAAEQWTPPPGGIFVAFSNDEIALNGNEGSVRLTLKATRPDPATGEPVDLLRDLRVQMTKQNGDWLIRSVAPVDLSEKAPPGTP